MVSKRGELSDDVVDQLELPLYRKSHPASLNRIILAIFIERLAFWGIWYLILTKSAIAGEERYDYAIITIILLACVPCGYLIDRYLSIRNAILWSGLVLAVGYFGLGVPLVFVGYMSILLIALGSAFYRPSMYKLLDLQYRSAVNSLNSGIHLFLAAFWAGAFTSYIFCTTLLNFLSWSQVVMICGILMLTGHFLLIVGGRVFQFAPEVLPHDDDQNHQTLASNTLIAVCVVIAFFFSLGNSLVGNQLSLQMSKLDFGRSINALYYFENIALIFLLLAGAWWHQHRSISSFSILAYGALLSALVHILGYSLHGELNPDSQAWIIYLTLLAFFMLKALIAVLIIPQVFSLVLKLAGGHKAMLAGLVILAFIPNESGLFSKMIGDDKESIFLWILLSGAALVIAGLWLLGVGRKEAYKTL